MNILPKTDRMPVLFLGHGSPMNALPGNAYYQSWQGLGAQFGTQWPRPRHIVCVSAHWLTNGWWLTAMTQPKTIHDFGGFPQALFEQQYPAPGFPAAARELAEVLRQPQTQLPLQLDEQQWGLDHGAWGVLKPMFAAADIPVIQLSMDYRRPPSEHLNLGQQLLPLRDRGVLIVASGNIVHNLGTMQDDASPGQTYDWAREFDETIAGYLQAGDLQALQDFHKLGNIARLSHPTHEHFLPLLYAAGAAHAGEVPHFFNTNFQAASISMRSVIWG